MHHHQCQYRYHFSPGEGSSPRDSSVVAEEIGLAHKDFVSTNTQIHKHTNRQIQKNKQTQKHNFTNTQLHIYTRDWP